MRIDKENLQNILEREACKKNRGMCESYNYCDFCKEPQNIYRSSNTPCADAYIDMKSISKRLQNMISDKEYIEVNEEKIKIWKKEFQEKWNDEKFLQEWYLDLNREDNFGMPKAKNKLYSSPIDNEIIERDNVRQLIRKFIETEEGRLKTVKREYFELVNAIDKLNDKEKFLVQCRYGDMKLNLQDTIVSFNKKFNQEYTLDGIKNKMSNIKKKIYKNLKKN